AGLNRTWKKPVVRIQKRDIFAPAGSETGISRCGESLVGLANIANRLERPRYRRGIVRGSIIHHQHLALTILLRECAFNRVRQIARLIETDDYDGHKPGGLFRWSA